MRHGIIDGNLTVERDAVVYFEGIVKGDVLARGAICMDGIVNGKIHDEDGAAVAFDGIVGNEGRPKSS